MNRPPASGTIGTYNDIVVFNWETTVNKPITFLLVMPLLAFPTWVTAQSDQTYATYITEEQW